MVMCNGVYFSYNLKKDFQQEEQILGAGTCLGAGGLAEAVGALGPAGAGSPSCRCRSEVWDVRPGAHVLGLVQRRWRSEPCLHIMHTFIEPWLFGD